VEQLWDPLRIYNRPLFMSRAGKNRRFCGVLAPSCCGLESQEPARCRLEPSVARGVIE